MQTVIPAKMETGQPLFHPPPLSPQPQDIHTSLGVLYLHTHVYVCAFIDKHFKLLLSNISTRMETP